MEDVTSNECLINTETQATEQPTNQQTQQPTSPEQNQEATETKKQEEKKMSEVDLSKMSLEELQAEIERRKQEETNKKNNANLGIDFNNPKQGDLVKWVYSHGGLAFARSINRDVDGRVAADFPGDIRLFVQLFDSFDDYWYRKNEVSEKEKVNHIRIWDVDIEHKQVLDCLVASSGDYNTFRLLISRLFK